MEVNGAAYVRYLNKSGNGVFKMRENCQRRLSELHAEDLIQRQSDSFSAGRRQKIKGDGVKDLKGKTSTKSLSKKQLMVQNITGITDRTIKLNASFTRSRGKNQQINLLKQSPGESIETIQPKVQMRCEDGVVVINGEEDPIFIPKLNLDIITNNREIYQPLPVPRRTILSQNDEIFKGVMENKQKSLCDADFATLKLQNSECWSTRSHIPSDLSDLFDESTSSDESNPESSQESSKKSRSLRRQNTFMFKSVNSILNKICKLPTNEKNGQVFEETGEEVIAQIQCQRVKSFTQYPIQYDAEIF